MTRNKQRGLVSILVSVLFSLLALGCNDHKIDIINRLEYETKIKEIANNLSLLVSIQICGGFFVDRRGYFVTAGHCLDNRVPGGKLDFTFGNKDERFFARARIVEEIQTLDLVVLAYDNQIDFSVAEFADLSSILKGDSLFLDNKLELEDSLVAVRCINRFTPVVFDRIYVGMLKGLDKNNSSISFLELVGNLDGCSGSPIINLDGKVVGMMRSFVGDMVFGVDASSIRDAVKHIIEKDVAKRKLTR